MELTDRERRILAELEVQLTTGGPASPASGRPAEPARRRLRPRWTVMPSAVLGCLLFTAGIAVHVGSAVSMGTLLLVWWLAPWLWRLLRLTGRSVLGSTANPPPDATR
jgi:hypothetical protein